MNTQENNSDQGKESKKVLANFEQTIKKLTAVVQGPENLKPVRKIKQDSVQSLVQELFKEESEATAKEVKEELKALLKGHVVLNNTLNEERRKLDALEVAKKKEFNTTAAKLFAKIDGIDSLSKEYYTAFQAAEEAVVESAEEETEE